MTDFMVVPFVKGLELADGVGIAPTQPGGSLGFRDRGITALPTIRNGQGGRSCTCDLLVPNPDASGLLTLHPEIGCQGWTRTNTVRFNKPSCYFDTTWQWRCRQEFHLHRSV